MVGIPKLPSRNASYLYLGTIRTWTALSEPEQNVPMLAFASRLRQRAAELGLSNAEVARRAGLSERRYANYVADTREPDLATLVRIADALGTTLDWLLGAEVNTVEQDGARALMLDRLIMAARHMSDEELRLTVTQAEAVAMTRERLC